MGPFPDLIARPIGVAIVVIVVLVPLMAALRTSNGRSAESRRMRRSFSLSPPLVESLPGRTFCRPCLAWWRPIETNGETSGAVLTRSSPAVIYSYCTDTI